MSKEITMEDIIVNKFTEESSLKFRKEVLAKAAMDPNMPIIIYIDSYGGSVDALNSMLSTLESVPNTIITVAIGKSMSCGAVLLSAGDVRFMDKHARILIHEVSSGTGGSVDDIKTDAAEIVRLNLQVMNFIAKRCGLTYAELKKKIIDNEGRDLTLTPQQAKELGLIEYIGLPQIKPMVMYGVELIPDKKYEKVIEEVPVKKAKKKVTKKIAKKKKKK